MSQILTCYRCPVAKEGCGRREQAQRDAKAGGFRTVAFRCDVKRDMFPIGAPARFEAWTGDGDDQWTEPVNVIIIGWSKRKLRLQAIEPFDGRTIFKVWPDRVTPTPSVDRRALCKCGYATTPLGSCVQPFPGFQCYWLDRRTRVSTYWGDERYEPLNEYGPRVSP